MNKNNSIATDILTNKNEKISKAHQHKEAEQQDQHNVAPPNQIPINTTELYRLIKKGFKKDKK